MADVISVTLEANISSRTSGAFKNFDRLVKGLGKSVLSFRKHTDSTETSVKRLNTALSRKSGFSEFDRKLVSSTKKVRGLNHEVKGLRDMVVKLSNAFQGFAKSTSAPLHTASQNLQNVRRSAIQTAAAYRHAQTQLAGLQRRAGRSPAGVRMPNVNIYGNGGNRSGGGIGGGGGSLSSTRMLQAGGSAAILGGSITMAGSSILNGAMGILTSGKELEKAVASLSARLDPGQRGIVGTLEVEARKLSKQFGILPSEIISAFEEAAAMGVTGKSLVASGSAISTMAQAGDMQTDRAAKGLGMILASYGFKDKDNNVDFGRANDLGEGGKMAGTGLVDLITYVAGKTQSNESEMMRAFEYSAATFKAAGIDVVKSSIYLGAASDVARTGTKGGRDMAEIIARASRSEVGEKVQKSLGVSMVDEDGNLKDTISVMAEIGLAFEQFTEGGTKNQAEALSLQREFFGEQGLKAFHAFQSSLEKSRQLEADIRGGKAKGSAAEKAGRKSNTFHHDLIRLQGAWQAFSKAILETNRGPISMFLGMLTKGLNIMTEFATNHPVLAQTFLLGTIAAGTFLVAGGAVVAMLGTIGFAAGGIASSLQIIRALLSGNALAGLGKVFPSVGGKFGIMARGTVILNRLGTRFPILARGAGLFSRTIGAVSRGVSGLGARALPMLGRAGAFLGSVFGSGAGGVAARFVALRGGLLALGGAMGPVGWIITGVATAIWLLWKPIKYVAGLIWDFAGGVWSGFMETIKPAVDELMASFGGLWDELTSVFDGISSEWEWFQNLFKTEDGAPAKYGQMIGKVIGQVAIPAIRMLTKGMEWLIRAVSFGKSVFSGIVSVLTSWYSPFRWIYEIIVLTTKAVGEFINSLWNLGVSAWEYVSPVIDAFKEVISWAKEAAFYANPLNWGSDYVEEEKKQSLVDTRDSAWSKLNSKGGIANQVGPDLMGSDVLNRMITEKSITAGELIALKDGNESAPEYKKINFTPEQDAYIEEVRKSVAAAGAKGEREGAASLTSAPTINITVNGNVHGTPEAIGAEVKKAADSANREYFARQREIYGNDGTF